MKNTNRPVVVLNRTRLQKKKKKDKITPIGKLIRLAGSAGGGAIGGYFGAPSLGASAGTQLGALASKWLGFGAYKVNRNSILKSTMGVPAMHNTSQSVVVRHKEYIGPINSSTGFTVQYELPLNPALIGTFPWLSGVAQRYQEYAFKGVVFHYVPSSGSAISGTSPSLGTVMVQTSYRASDGPPLNKVEMLNEYCASEAVPSEPFIHPIECDPKENPFNVHYCRSQAPPSGEPLMSYDLGRTFVATQGQLAGGNVLGDLWVTYEVELKKPVVRTDVTNGEYFYSTTTVPTTTNMFNNPVEVGSLQVDLPSPNTIVLPENSAQQFVIAVTFPSSNFSAFAQSGITISNGTRGPVDGDGNLVYSNTVLSGSAKACFINVIRRTVLTKPTLINFTAPTWTGTPGECCLSIWATNFSFPP